MYAVIETGGKQYRVEVGTELEVELLDVEPGKTITIDRVLLVADGDESSIGRPLVADAAVSAEVLDQTRGPKLISFKYRPKARSRVKKGHRQELTVLRIADITFGGKSAAKAAQKAERRRQDRARALAEAAATQAAKDAELAAKLAVGAEDKPAKAKAETATKAKTEAEGEDRGPRPRPTQGQAEDKSTAKADARRRPARPRPTARRRQRSRRPPRPPPPKAKAEAPKKPRATKKDE